MASRSTGSVSNITGLLNESELDIVNIKVLKNLQHQTLGLMRSASPSNPATVAAGGTAVFRIQKYLKSKEYTVGNRNDAGDLPKQEVKVKADIKGSIKFHYELETLDLPGLSFENRSAFISYITAGVSMSMTALIDALVLQLAVETAAVASRKATAEVINADFADLDTAVKREGAFRQVARAKVDVARNLTDYNIGTNEGEYATYLHKNVTNDLLLAMPKGGDSATAIGRDLSGVDGITNIAGLGPVKDHIFFNKNITKGANSFSTDKDFNFSNVFGVTLHSEALFVATQGLITTGVTDPNSGNQKYITKFNYFQDAIRPKLLRVYRSVATA